MVGRQRPVRVLQLHLPIELSLPRRLVELHPAGPGGAQAACRFTLFRLGLQAARTRYPNRAVAHLQRNLLAAYDLSALLQHGRAKELHGLLDRVVNHFPARRRDRRRIGRSTPFVRPGKVHQTAGQPNVALRAALHELPVGLVEPNAQPVAVDNLLVVREAHVATNDGLMLGAIERHRVLPVHRKLRPGRAVRVGLSELQASGNGHKHASRREIHLDSARLDLA